MTLKQSKPLSDEKKKLLFMSCIDRQSIGFVKAAQKIFQGQEKLLRITHFELRF